MTKSQTTPPTTPADVLRDVFGFESFLPGQEAVIAHLLAGRSALAIFPTGGGKSLFRRPDIPENGECFGLVS